MRSVAFYAVVLSFYEKKLALVRNLVVGLHLKPNITVIHKAGFAHTSYPVVEKSGPCTLAAVAYR